MKRIALFLFAVQALTVPALASGQEQVRLLKPAYQFNKATITRGAEFFFQHCIACHSVSRIRYSRLSSDLGLSVDEIKKLMPAGSSELGQGITTAMPPEAAKQAFGVVPPDLSLEARYRGEDWIYTFLQSFYVDPASRSGWNNQLFPKVAMPNILAGLSGTRDASGKWVQPASVPPEQFQKMVGDVTAWLRYASDPSVLTRREMGPYVLAFIALFTGLAYWTKRTYWKAV
jgi:ubiquinol-cytochrome c reductase cytochrome c1 subunit